MKQEFSIAKITLWLFVIALGIEIGGGLYETLVVMPTWALSPPDSVLAYHQHNMANPQFTISAGPRFWMIQTPLVGVLALATLLTGFGTRAEHRKWRIAGTVLALVVVAATFAWFVPNLLRLLGDTVMTMSREDVASTTNWWVSLNWVRVVVYSAAWLCALRAFSIPLQASGGD